MQRCNWLREAVGFGLLMSIGSGAGAVVVFNGTAPHVYAVTYLSEDWTQQPGFMGGFGFRDDTEQLEGSESISSSQLAGIDAVPNPECSPPCVGQTAEASASYMDGAILLSASSHAYANFDNVVRIGDQEPYSYEPAYLDGNIVRSETDAAVFDLITVTETVQLDFGGHLTGDILYSSASDSEIYPLEGVAFGTGAAEVALVVSLRSTPIQSFISNPVTINRNATKGSSQVVDEDFAASIPDLPPGNYILRADLRTTVRIGSVNNPTLAVQDMRSAFGNTATLRLVASNPAAISSASGLFTFTVPEPDATLLGESAMAAIALTRRRRR